MSKRKHDETFLSTEATREGQSRDPAFAEWYERYPTRQDISAAVRRDIKVLFYAPEEIRGDPEIVLEAIQMNEQALSFATDELRENLDFARKAVRMNCWTLEYGAPEEIRGDRDFFMELVCKEDGWSLLKYASRELQNDRELVVAAIRNNADALFYASPELRANRDIVMEAVRKEGCWLSHVSEELRGDRELVSVAIGCDAWAFEHASPELRGDRQVAIQAVRRNGNMLRFALEELRNDREFVLVAIRRNGGALEYASPELRGDEQIVTEAVTEDGTSLRYASRDLCEQPSIVGLAISNLEPGRPMDNVIGYFLESKLRLVLRVLQEEIPEWVDFQEAEYFEDIESVQRCSNQWRQSPFEKVCLLWKICRETGVARDQYEMILDFWDVKRVFQMARDLDYCSPVLAAFGGQGYSFCDTEAFLDDEVFIFEE